MAGCHCGSRDRSKTWMANRNHNITWRAVGTARQQKNASMDNRTRKLSSGDLNHCKHAHGNHALRVSKPSAKVDCLTSPFCIPSACQTRGYSLRARILGTPCLPQTLTSQLKFRSARTPLAYAMHAFRIPRAEPAKSCASAHGWKNLGFLVWMRCWVG